MAPGRKVPERKNGKRPSGRKTTAHLTKKVSDIQRHIESINVTKLIFNNVLDYNHWSSVKNQLIVYYEKLTEIKSTDVSVTKSIDNLKLIIKNKIKSINNVINFKLNEINNSFSQANSLNLKEFSQRQLQKKYEDLLAKLHDYIKISGDKKATIFRPEDYDSQLEIYSRIISKIKKEL